MSKSKNNYIGITEPANTMFAKILSISDVQMWKWYELLSFKSIAEIAALKAEVEGGRNPKDAKVMLAKEITTRFHSAAAADAAEHNAIVLGILRQEGARQVYACATHAVFSPPAIERLSSGIFEEVIVTNTIPVPDANRFKQLTVLSVANLLGETIWRIHEDNSVSSMFR